MMIPRKSGLIVNVSSFGGINYLFTALYGIGKMAVNYLQFGIQSNASIHFQCDRMAVDCAYELKQHNVAFISLWPGVVKTEAFVDLLDQKKKRSYRECTT
jgi:dehydrogenase/reductase SDR family protein 1